MQATTQAAPSLHDPTLYHRDLYAWAQTNAQLLRQRKFSELDLENLIEEIEDMGKSEQRGIYSHLLNLVMHLLKWDYQKNIQSHSWRVSIVNARLAIIRLQKQNPSLINAPANDLSDAYQDAVKLAALETGLNLDAFPKQCPYAIEQVLNEDWLPG